MEAVLASLIAAGNRKMLWGLSEEQVSNALGMFQQTGQKNWALSFLALPPSPFTLSALLSGDKMFFPRQNIIYFGSRKWILPAVDPLPYVNWPNSVKLFLHTQASSKTQRHCREKLETILDWLENKGSPEELIYLWRCFPFFMCQIYVDQLVDQIMQQSEVIGHHQRRNDG